MLSLLFAPIEAMHSDGTRCGGAQRSVSKLPIESDPSRDSRSSPGLLDGLTALPPSRPIRNVIILAGVWKLLGPHREETISPTRPTRFPARNPPGNPALPLPEVSPNLAPGAIDAPL